MKWGRYIVIAQDYNRSKQEIDHRFSDTDDLLDAEHQMFEWRLQGWESRIADTENLEDANLTPEMIDRFREIILTMGGKWTARWQ